MIISNHSSFVNSENAAYPHIGLLFLFAGRLTFGARFVIILYFQYYGETVVDQEKWNVIRNRVKEHGAKAIAVIDELSGWAEENYQESSYFVIIGI